MTPKLKAQQEIDRLLTAAGWQVCDMAQANIHAVHGVAVREFLLATGHGFADYLLDDCLNGAPKASERCVDGRAN